MTYTLTSSWWDIDDVTYAEVTIDAGVQRLVAHAENTDRDQLVADLRQLSARALDLAGEIERETDMASLRRLAPSMAPASDPMFGPHLATADDVIAGRARYADTPGGHADRRAGRTSGEMPGWDG
ncbi:hypothetical protein [Nocardioides nitrophenolicus]|uniref:hypothetical protein n=1 Tax=Nocardioides nitrophenolicus TaxID=60489 RepID=UPI0019572497|nr:hypothetical protein [Nocardioides nitrophenolicus]MBM7518293.1 hypothetical protein [Nocardioides nitrophenolicus]